MNKLRLTSQGIRQCILASLLPATLIGSGTAEAYSSFGSLGNFDVINDTGAETNGFEIELHGIQSQDVTYTFGDPYIRYGNPKITDFTDSSGQPSVRIRWQSTWNPGSQQFSNGTPPAIDPTMTTQGHQCYIYGDPGYLTSGCEHFGVGTINNPTQEVYHWLVKDPGTPGSLMYSTGQISLPAPIQNVLPPANPAVAPAAVQAVVKAPEIQQEDNPNREYGEPMWVKVFKTEAPEKADLHHLVTDDPKVPQDAAKIETDWKMLQKRLRNGAGAKDDEAIEADAASDSDSVTRRYEFYKYGGTASTFDVETGEAMCDKVDTDGIHGKGKVNVTTWDPQNPGETTTVKVDCSTEVVVGAYIGAQMEAVNIADIDADGVNDDQPAGDNCALRPNTNQRDTDNDGWGNVCDPDLDNNGIVNNTDLAEVKKKLNKTGAAAAHADLDGDGKVNFKDLAIVNSYMGKGPGPKTSEVP